MIEKLQFLLSLARNSGLLLLALIDQLRRLFLTCYNIVLQF